MTMMIETMHPNELLDTEPQTTPLREADCNDSHAVGDAVERFAADYFDLTHDRAVHHDARTETGAPVQTKGARWRIRNGTGAYGQKYAHGRFRLYECDHAWLTEHDGWYAFVVYEKLHDAIVPVYARMMRPQDVADWVLPDEPWHTENGDVPKENGSDYRLSWPKAFPRAEGTL